ncbi:hypothetical protein GCM10010377_78630 [Streptomyces viridiviolaceus]|nr:hypothetical protein GCM10010377_78630 [Streptomyces viridiviolaceus]
MGISGDDDRTGRGVHFIPQRVVAGQSSPLQVGTATAAPDGFRRRVGGHSGAKDRRRTCTDPSVNRP